MSQALHIFKKDLRRGWPLLLLWGALLVLRPVSGWVDPMDLGTLREEGGGMALLLLTLAAMVGAVMVVQQDSLVGERELWMTRPIRPWALMAAKAMFIGLFLVAPPIALDFAARVHFGLPSGLWPAHLVEMAMPWASLVAFAALLGAWTRGLPGFFALLFGFLIVPNALAELWNQYRGSEGLVAVSTPPSRDLGVLFVALLAVQYRTRRRVFGALLGVVMLPVLWIWPLPLYLNVYPEQALKMRLGETRIELTAGPSRETLPATRFPKNGFASTKLWFVPEQGAVPGDSLYQISFGGGKIDWRDGGANEVSAGGWQAVGLPAGLKWARWGSPGPAWESLAVHTLEPLERLLGRSGRLRSEGGAHVWKAADSRSLPLTPGAEVVRDDFRARILAIERSAQPFQIVVRQQSIPPVGRIQIVQEPRFFLVNRSLGEAAALRPAYRNGRAVSGWPVTSGNLLEVREDGWSVDVEDPSLVPADWLEGAEALIVFYELAGTLDVELYANDIEVDGAASPEPTDSGRAAF